MARIDVDGRDAGERSDAVSRRLLPGHDALDEFRPSGKTP
jgi:hypothetical protein